MSEKYRKITEAIAVVVFAIFLSAVIQNAGEDMLQSDTVVISDDSRDEERTADDLAEKVPSPDVLPERTKEALIAGGQPEKTEEALTAGDQSEETEEVLTAVGQSEETEEVLTAVGQSEETEELLAPDLPAEETEEFPAERMDKHAEPDELSGDPEQDEPVPIPIPDLSGEYAVILRGVTGEAIAGYPVDDTFLMWLYARCGDNVIRELATLVADGGMNAGCWQELTGATIHALWMEYCRDTGYQSDLPAQVHWAGDDGGGAVVLGFAGDTGADARNRISAALVQTGGKKAGEPDGPAPAEESVSGISEELFARMQETDIVFLNCEFTNPTEKETENAASEETGEWVDVRASQVPGEWTDARAAEVSGRPQSAEGIRYYVAGGRKIGVVSLSFVNDDTGSQSGREASVPDPAVARAVALISEADARSDTVVVLVRWGTEGNLYPDQTQTAAARAFAAAGADAIIGGHAHRLQGVGYISGVPVAYSLGNFRLSDGLLYTAFLRLTISENGTIQMCYVPCIQEAEETRVLTDGAECAAFYHYMMAISSSAGMDAEGTVVNLRAEAVPYAAETASDSHGRGLTAAGTASDSHGTEPTAGETASDGHGRGLTAGEIVYHPDNSTTAICGMGDLNGVPIDPLGNYKDL